MTESRPQLDPSTEEQASLYALQVMPAAERCEFELKLARNPALRDLVRALQASVEEEVFGEPAPAAPLQVWGRISAQARTDDLPVLIFPRPMRRWGRRLLAAAACLAAGAGLHAWWSGRLRPTIAHERETPAAAISNADQPMADTLPFRPARPSELANNSAPRNAATVPTVPATPALREVETEQLKNRILVLADQVAALNQVLTQRIALPNGVARLHVFHLGPPGAAGATDREAHPQKLAEVLANLAASQLASATSPAQEITIAPVTPEDPEASASQPEPAKAPVPPVSIVQIVPANPSPVETTATAVDGSPAGQAGQTPTETLAASRPIVFVDPDTGKGAITFNQGTDLKNQFQLWSANADGTFSSLGVVPNSSSPFVVVTFDGPTDGSFTSPMLSLEPAGGSSQPTGSMLRILGSTNAVPSQP